MDVNWVHPINHLTEGLGELRGSPKYEGTYPFDFRIMESFDGGVTWTRNLLLRYNLIVLGPNPEPMILTERLPDAMIGTPYSTEINTLYFDTQGFPVNPMWMSEGDNNRELANAGLTIKSTAPFTSAVIVGMPTEALDSLTGGNVGTNSNIYEFTVRIRLVEPFGDLTKIFRIRVWPQPTITPPKWNDGMENQPYNPEFIGDPDESDPFILNNASALLDAFPDRWRWEQIIDIPPPEGWSNRLPDGLEFGFVDPGDDDNDIPPDLTQFAIFGTPKESTAGNYRITLVFKSINRNAIQGDVNPITFDIKIWPRPEIKDWDIHGGKLPDGMVGPCSDACTNLLHDKPPAPFSASPTVTWNILLPEPEEVYAPAMGDIKPFDGARIEASIPEGLGIKVTGGVPQITWNLWSGNKSAPALHPLNVPVIDSSGLVYSTSQDNISYVGENLYIRGNTTDETEAKDHKLNLGFVIEHENPNIDGARTDETFDLRIWRRSYLSVRMRHPDLDWETVGSVRRSGVTDFKEHIEGYRGYARAVIPGQWGTIQSIQSGSNFIRWEVLTPITIPFERLSPGAQLTEWPGIGGNWELTVPGATAMGWAHIRMPLPPAPDAVPINVIISGFHVEAPRVTGSLDRVEKDKDFTRTLLINNATPRVLGTGPLPIESWQLSNRSGDTFPYGVNVIPSTGITCVITGTPTETEPGEFPKTFNFHVDVTLKGSMRLTYGSSGLVRNDGTTSIPYSLLVDTFRPDWGDFDGKDGLNMADLVLLSRWVLGTDLQKANAKTEMEVRDGWRNSITPKNSPDQMPDGSDLAELERWFANDGARRDWVPPSN
jgi:hypothetical protein